MKSFKQFNESVFHVRKHGVSHFYHGKSKHQEDYKYRLTKANEHHYTDDINHAVNMQGELHSKGTYSVIHHRDAGGSWKPMHIDNDD